MKKVGIIGGTGPESTIDYYKMIINKYQSIKKDGSYPEILIYSIDLQKAVDFINDNKLADLADYLLNAINSLYKAGADFGIVAANTPHLVFDLLIEKSPISLLSIIEETCKKTDESNIKRVGLLGTKFIMQSDLYKNEMQKYNISVVIPNEDEIKKVHNWIFSELELGIIKDETRKGFLDIIKRMKDEDKIEGLILGCTELPLILKNDEFNIKFLNTTEIHVDSVIKEMMI